MALGLAAYKQRKVDEEARRAAAQKPKVQRFALAKDGDSAVIRFAQEMDFDAKNYSEARGIGFVNIEHNHPDPQNGWKNRANCSIETQGACLPCEKVSDYSVEWADRKGWKQKEKFYINLIGGEPKEVPNPKKPNKTMWIATDIDRETGDGTVYLLEQGTYNGIFESLADYFVEEEVSGGTITDKYFKIARKGNNFNDTSYSITPLKEIGEGAKPLDEFEIYNIKEDVVTEVQYQQQDAFYHRDIGGGSAPVSEPSSAPTPAASTAVGTDEGW